MHKALTFVERLAEREGSEVGRERLPSQKSVDALPFALCDREELYARRRLKVVQVESLGLEEFNALAPRDWRELRRYRVQRVP